MNQRILLPGFAWEPCWWLGKLKPWGVRDRRYKEPRLLVVHCGSLRDDLAGYLANPTEPAPKPGQKNPPIHCKDGKWRRQVATHGAWRPETQQLVQMVGMELESWGTGTSEWHGIVANRIAIHVELPGPPEQDRAGVQTDELRRYALACKGVWASLAYWTRHSLLDDEKHDPGPGLDDGWAKGILSPGF